MSRDIDNGTDINDGFIEVAQLEVKEVTGFLLLCKG